MERMYLKMKDKQKIFLQYYIKQERNTTLLYVHGGPGQGCWDFKYSADMLSQSYNVILYDQRGCLRSDAVTDHFSSELLLEDIEEIRQHFNMDQLILCGHSYGGHLILRYALKHPNHVKGLIYVCPTFDFESSMKNVYRIGYQLMDSSAYCDQLAAIKEGVKDDTPTSYRKHLVDIPEEIRAKIYFSAPVSQQVKDAIFDSSITDEDWKKGIEQQNRIFDEEEIYKNYMPFLKQITIPSLLIVGEYDPICCEIQQKAFMDAPNHSMAVIKNAGHSLYVDHADDFVHEINQFMKQMLV